MQSGETATNGGSISKKAQYKSINIGALTLRESLWFGSQAPRVGPAQAPTLKSHVGSES